jgi:hypothetical protein
MHTEVKVKTVRKLMKKGLEPCSLRSSGVAAEVNDSRVIKEFTDQVIALGHPRSGR